MHVPHRGLGQAAARVAERSHVCRRRCRPLEIKGARNVVVGAANTSTGSTSLSGGTRSLSDVDALSTPSSLTLADGTLHAQERKTLELIASKLGVSRPRLDAILARVSGQAGFESADESRSKLSAAYALLAIESSASMEEVKRAYRRQMSQHHPDKLVAKGLPEEMIDIANRKTQDIKSAYDLIRKSREG